MAPGSIPVVTVDAFTSHRFGGNPAGVCVLDRALDGGLMQRLAAELNLPETAFLFPDGSGWNIRWFAPAAEVPLCGHATLASAHVLWETGRVKRGERISFESMSGSLGAWQEGELIGLDFPGLPGAVPASVPGLAEALGTPLTGVLAIGNWRIGEVASESALVSMKPDFSALARLDLMVVGVTAPGDPGADYVCRVFAPKAGVNEDPVTGSVQCALGPLWAGRLKKSSLRVRQRSARGGELLVRVTGDRVHILGHAVTVLTGSLVV